MSVNLAEIKNAMTQLQSKLDALTVRVNEAEERISEMEDQMVEEKLKQKLGSKNQISRM